MDFVRVADHESMETPPSPKRLASADGRSDIERLSSDPRANCGHLDLDQGWVRHGVH
jgi:hypothetical protein